AEQISRLQLRAYPFVTPNRRLSGGADWLWSTPPVRLNHTPGRSAHTKSIRRHYRSSDNTKIAGAINPGQTDPVAVMRLETSLLRIEVDQLCARENETSKTNEFLVAQSDRVMDNWNQ